MNGGYMKKKIFTIAFISVFIDQISKIFVSSNFILFNRIPVIKDFFYLTYVKNEGGAWSILNGNRFLLIGITIVALYFILRYIIKEENINKIDSVSYGLLIGGILGNLIDRIIHGYVIDFFDFIIFGYNYPVFNFADTFIVVGVILMIMAYIRSCFNENSGK